MSTRTSSVSRVVVVFARAFVARVRHSRRAIPSRHALYRITHQYPMYHHFALFRVSHISLRSNVSPLRARPRRRLVASPPSRASRRAASSRSHPSIVVVEVIVAPHPARSTTARARRIPHTSPRARRLSLAASPRVHPRACRTTPTTPRASPPRASPRARRTAPPSVDDDAPAPRARGQPKPPRVWNPRCGYGIDGRVWCCLCEWGVDDRS